jgi:hypothetical protein
MDIADRVTLLDHRPGAAAGPNRHPDITGGKLLAKCGRRSVVGIRLDFGDLLQAHAGPRVRMGRCVLDLERRVLVDPADSSEETGPVRRFGPVHQ